MQFAVPPVASAINATVNSVDQGEPLTPPDEVVDWADLRQMWA
ncbi:hypothetical protein ABZ260_08465 [Streptosporangium sp. NPDC006013]